MGNRDAPYESRSQNGALSRMKLLILGANGMLGHMMWEEARMARVDTYATVRRPPPIREPPFPQERVRLEVDVERYASVLNALNGIRPDVVINCIGVVKQSPIVKDPVKTIYVNSLFPHLLARDCLRLGIRLIHLSTDCVFSGKKGDYNESDQPDPTDFYGVSKWIGEPSTEKVLVIRTSMLGPELEKRQGLLEWFLAQRGKTIRGFTNAIFSGFYTRSLAALILEIASQSSISGLRHLSSDPISKYTLLEKIREACRLPIEIVPDGNVRLDRSLDSTLIRSEGHLEMPSWDGMIELLVRDLRREGRI